jgi:hypothetical protein
MLNCSNEFIYLSTQEQVGNIELIKVKAKLEYLFEFLKKAAGGFTASGQKVFWKYKKSDTALLFWSKKKWCSITFLYFQRTFLPGGLSASAAFFYKLKYTSYPFNF